MYSWSLKVHVLVGSAVGSAHSLAELAERAPTGKPTSAAHHTAVAGCCSSSGTLRGRVSVESIRVEKEQGSTATKRAAGFRHASDCGRPQALWLPGKYSKFKPGNLVASKVLRQTKASCECVPCFTSLKLIAKLAKV